MELSTSRTDEVLSRMRESVLIGDIVKERFFAKIVVSDKCWEWKAAKSSSNPSKAYGVFSVDGKLVKAHRLAFELFKNQRIQAGMLACHHCDNPRCVNPLHIFIGTSRDNVVDAENKGRLYHHKGVLMTHCRRGHPLTDSNIYVYHKSGDRVCRTCRAMRESRRIR